VKRTLLVILLLLSPFVHHAQTQNTEVRHTAFDPGDNIIGIAAGVQPARAYEGATYSAAFILTFDHLTINTLGPGALAAGVELGIYDGRHTNFPNDSWSKTGIAARVSYHLALLFNNRFDPYAGAALGLYSAPQPENEWPYHTDRYKSNAFLAPFIGARFNFTRHMGIWVEGGYDITNLKAGINFNF
jgi:hypothetical protein